MKVMQVFSKIEGCFAVKLPYRNYSNERVGT